MNQDSVFQPFDVRAQYSNGILSLEKAVFKNEPKACLDTAALLKKTLAVYVEEAEKLLHEAKNSCPALLMY